MTRLGLIDAVFSDSAASVEEAVHRRGANPNELLNDHRRTPMLVWAAQRGALNAMDALIKCGSDVNLPDATGTTALMAVAGGELSTSKATSMIECLIRGGVDLQQRDVCGDDALRIAACRRSEHRCQALISADARSTDRITAILVAELLAPTRSTQKC